MARLNRLKHIGLYLGWVLLTTPTSAHTVKVSGNVAATFHIEPNHNPKTGEPAQTWFVLTQHGGVLIPLSQCDCKLAVHLKPHQKGDHPVLEPILKPIAAQGYQGVPGTEILFPKPGEYTLELSGNPKAGGTFQPFAFSYEVIVASQSKATARSPAIATDPDQDPSKPHIVQSDPKATVPRSPLWLTTLITGMAIMGIGVTVLVLQMREKKQ